MKKVVKIYEYNRVTGQLPTEPTQCALIEYDSRRKHEPGDSVANAIYRCIKPAGVSTYNPKTGEVTEQPSPGMRVKLAYITVADATHLAQVGLEHPTAKLVDLTKKGTR